jgi:hypothetical protein
MTWKLIKTEFKYNGSMLFAAFAVYLAIVLFLYVGSRVFLLDEIPPIRQMRVALWIMLMMNWIMTIVAFFLTGVVKEKRNRLYLQLPVSTRQVAFSRILLIAGIWSASSTLFYLLLAAAGYLERFFHHSSYFTTFCTHLGGLFFWGSYMFWKKDFKSALIIEMKIFSFPVKKLLALFLDLVVAFLYIFFTVSPQVRYNNFGLFKGAKHPVRKALIWLFETPAGVLVFLAMGISMSLLMVFTFTHRKSYTN